MVQPKSEKSAARLEWSTDDLQELFQKVKKLASKSKKVIQWDKALKDLAWDDIAFNGHTAEECKAVFLELADRHYVRHYRLITEILDDLEHNAQAATPPFIPDPPKRPMPAYMTYANKHYQTFKEKNPDLNMISMQKVIMESFKNLSEKKRKKIEAEHEAELGKYNQELEEYFAKYPQMAKVKKELKAHDDEDGEVKPVKEKVPSPPKLPSLYTIVVQDMRAKMKEELGREVSHKEATERLGKNYLLTIKPDDLERCQKRYAKLKAKYDEEMAEFKEKYPEIAAQLEAKKKPQKEKTKPTSDGKDKKKTPPSPPESEDSDFAPPKPKKGQPETTIEDKEKSKKKKRKAEEETTEKEVPTKKAKGKAIENGQSEKEGKSKKESEKVKKTKSSDEDSEQTVKAKKETAVKDKTVKGKQKAKTEAKKKAESDTDSSDDEAEVTASTSKAKEQTKKQPEIVNRSPTKAKATTVPYPDSDSESDAEKKTAPTPSKTSSQPKPKTAAKSDSDSESDSESETEKKKATTPAKSQVSLSSKSPAKPAADSDSDSDSESEAEQALKAKPAPAAKTASAGKKAAPESDSDSESEPKSKKVAKAPATKAAVKGPVKAAPTVQKKSQDSGSSSSDEEQTKPVQPPKPSEIKGKLARKPEKKEANSNVVEKSSKFVDGLDPASLERRSYQELMEIARKKLPGIPERSFIGALDVFMDINPSIKTLDQARKKFKKLDDKEKKEIIAMYRKENAEFQQRLRQFFGGLSKEKKQSFKLLCSSTTSKSEEVNRLHAVEGQSESESSDED